LLAKNPSDVPTIWEQGLWDQEDMWGAIHSYESLVKAGKAGNNFIVMGPWRHSQINRVGSELGPFKWNGDTAAQYREDMILPFFNQYLKDGPAVSVPAATIYNTSKKQWDRFNAWPLACETGCRTYHLGESGRSRPLAQFKESFGAIGIDYAEHRYERLPFTVADQRLRAVAKKILRFRDV
jgi:predicted acyl esterase